MAELLGLEGEKHILNIKTLHGMKPIPCKRVAMALGSVDGLFSVPVTDVFTVDRLPCANIDAPLDLSRWSHLKDLKIDPTSHDEVGLLIGCDVPEAHWVLDQRIGGSNEPLAVKTPFGWTVRGKTGAATASSGRVGYIRMERVTIEDSQETIEREFSGPSDGDSDAPLKEDARELAIVKKPTRMVDVRSEVGVPWRPEQLQLLDDHGMSDRTVNLHEGEEVTKVVVGPRPQTVLDRLLAHYLTWLRLLRCVTWMRHFIRYVVVMRVGSLDHGLSLRPLSVSELDRTEKRLVSLIQQDSFELELSILRRGSNSRLKTSLARLKPVVQNGLLCLTGRLPRTLVILPQCHAAADRLIRYHHEACVHISVAHVLDNLRRNFWIVKLMSSVRRIVGRCLRCRASARPSEQIMPSLPAFRIDEGGSVFLEIGVGYFESFEIKKGRTTHKRYGRLFTFMKTKVAQTLSADSFMMALIRFVGSRATPFNIYNDNGSNFVGAEADPKRQVLQLNQTQLSVVLASRSISWYFNPPHASHRRSVWERMIRTTIRVLSAVVKHQALIDESLVTFMIEAERLVYDRLITPVFNDPIEPKALRPSDLLLSRRQCDEHMFSRYHHQVNTYLVVIKINVNLQIT